ncbi:hypothetical protein SNE40_019355 [Patella caerulea]|uniref:Protein sleepless n=1 Tax=Patella caerulea TaxID=87958 RepID=A0AAN8J8E9_PATCE
MNNYHCLSDFFVFAFYIPVNSLKCYQCNSLDNPNCLTAHLEPKECVGEHKEAKFCVKSIGFLNKGTLVIRMCGADYSIKNSCRPHKMEEGSLTNVCFHTCNDDACNSTQHQTPLIHLNLSSLFLIFCKMLFDFF